MAFQNVSPYSSRFARNIIEELQKPSFKIKVCSTKIVIRLWSLKKVLVNGALTSSFSHTFSHVISHQSATFLLFFAHWFISAVLCKHWQSVWSSMTLISKTAKSVREHVKDFNPPCLYRISIYTKEASPLVTRLDFV